MAMAVSISCAPVFSITKLCLVRYPAICFDRNRRPLISGKVTTQKSLLLTKATSSDSSSSSSSEAHLAEPMVPPYNVLITGSTKGIGYALAKEFLKAGDNVIICSRSDERVKSALESLQKETGKQHVVLSVMSEKEKMSRN